MSWNRRSRPQPEPRGGGGGDGTPWLIAGLALGAAVGVGGFILLRRRRQNADPSVTIWEVTRDDAGRIQSVHTIRNIGGTPVGGGVDSLPSEDVVIERDAEV